MVFLSFSTPKFHLGGALDAGSSDSVSLESPADAFALRPLKNGRRDVNEGRVASRAAMSKRWRRVERWDGWCGPESTRWTDR